MLIGCADGRSPANDACLCAVLGVVGERGVCFAAMQGRRSMPLRTTAMTLSRRFTCYLSARSTIDSHSLWLIPPSIWQPKSIAFLLARFFSLCFVKTMGLGQRLGVGNGASEHRVASVLSTGSTAYATDWQRTALRGVWFFFLKKKLNFFSTRRRCTGTCHWKMPLRAMLLQKRSRQNAEKNNKETLERGAEFFFFKKSNNQFVLAKNANLWVCVCILPSPIWR